MTSTPETPDSDGPDGADLAALREEIDELKAIPTEQLIEPLPVGAEEVEGDPEPTDAIGSEKWDLPVEDESLEQE